MEGKRVIITGSGCSNMKTVVDNYMKDCLEIQKKLLKDLPLTDIIGMQPRKFTMVHSNAYTYMALINEKLKASCEFCVKHPNESLIVEDIVLSPLERLMEDKKESRENYRKHLDFFNKKSRR